MQMSVHRFRGFADFFYISDVASSEKLHLSKNEVFYFKRR